MTGEFHVWKGPAPAKINLQLAIYERERDGYHRLETIFQRLELADRVEITIGDGAGTEKGGVLLQVTGVEDGELGPDSENLAVRAARKFLEAVGGRRELPGTDLLASGIQIRLEKKIPSGAGLGGGSSDAATVLRGLNELAGNPLKHLDLARLGGELGSDVPFFLSGVARAAGSGRGDRIAPLPSLPVRPILLAVPPERISTAWAYNVLAEARAADLASQSAPSTPTHEPARASVPPTERWNQVAAIAHNDFEQVLFPLRPDLARLKETLQEAGARPALLSGSGAVVFGVFRDAREVDRAKKKVAATHSTVHLIRTKTVG